MTRIMNAITAFLWLSLALPLFIGFGSLHALDVGDYFGGVVALLFSFWLFASLGIGLRLIYVSWYNTRNHWQNRIDFAESILLGFVYLGVFVSVPGLMMGVFSFPTNQLSLTAQAMSVPFLIIACYLLWGYFVPRSQWLKI